MDYQMDCIKSLLIPHADEIAAAENEMTALSYKMFEITEEFLEGILHNNWMGPNSKLALIGGIMINCVGEKTDMFLPLKFEIRNKDGESKDLYELWESYPLTIKAECLHMRRSLHTDIR